MGETFSLKIIDDIKLKSGAKAMKFKETGGYIGSDSSCQWVVQDVFNNIAPKHIHIKYAENNFGIAPVSNNELYLNNDFSPIRKGYYISLVVGDKFRIGEIEFLVVNEDEIDDTAEDEAVVEDIESYNKLDNIEIKPAGQQEGIKMDDEISTESLVTDSEDVLGIGEEFLKPEPVNSNNPVRHIILTEDVLLNFIHEKCSDLLLKHLKHSSALMDIVQDEKSRLTVKDLEHIFSNYSLINDVRVINLLTLSILYKELNSPFFEELEQDSFEKIISTLVKKSSSEQHMIERLLVRAIKKYIRGAV